MLRILSPVSFLALLAPLAAAEDRLELLPARFELHGPALGQRLLLEEARDGAYLGQAAGEVSYESSDPSVVRVEGGLAAPVGNGRATITARAGGRSAASEVTVSGLDRPWEWSFRNHVQSVLTKAGCNSGACHGALAGKNGFHLSLRGYDPEGDFLTLTRQARGR